MTQNRKKGKELMNLGSTELIIVLLVVVLLFGGQKIPELMRGVGKGISELRKGIDEGRRTLDDSLKGQD